MDANVDFSGSNRIAMTRAMIIRKAITSDPGY
jgi:hypothetical protein